MRIGNIKSIALVLIVNIVLLESFCLAFLLLASRTHGHYFVIPWSQYDEQVSTFSDQQVLEISRSFDRILSWDTTPGSAITRTNIADEPYTETINESGERACSAPYDSVVISSYGDSHTIGAEVNDDESWQCVLQARLGMQVQNFGVGGYGTDQALLKLERRLEQGFRTPYVVLGIHEENIGRTLNTYRPFYFNYPGTYLTFKPRYLLESGKLSLLETAYNLSTVEDVKRAIRVAAQNDYWYALNQAQMARIKPSFTWHALDLFLIVLERRGLFDHPFKGPIDFCPSCYTPPSPWHVPEADALMSAIIDRYVALSKEYDFFPIVLFYPLIIPGTESGTGYEPPYHTFSANLQRRHSIEDLQVIDMSDRINRASAPPIDMSRYKVTPTAGHTSAYGNRIIAEFVHQSLENSPMFDENAATSPIR